MIKRFLTALTALTLVACVGAPPAPVQPSQPTQPAVPTQAATVVVAYSSITPKALPLITTLQPLPATAIAATQLPTATSPPTEAPTTTLLFTGDINPGRCVAKSMIAKNDFNFPYEALAPDLQAADILVGSLAGSITDKAHISDRPKTM